MIELLAERKMVVWVHIHGRPLDMTKARDRRDLQEDAVDSEYESAKTSARTKRDHEARAARGGPAGRLSFGQKAIYNPDTGKLIGRVVVPDEFVLVDELLTRFVAGESLWRLEKNWLARGIVNRSGNSFGQSQLRDMLRNRNYIGERVHVAGKTTRWWKASPEDVTITKGNWTFIEDEKERDRFREKFLTAQAMLSEPGRKKHRSGGATHLLTMFSKCDPCGGPLTARKRAAGQRYIFHNKGCVSISEPELDEFAVEVLHTWLESDEAFNALSHGKADLAELVAAQTEVKKLDTDHNDMIAAKRANRMSLKAFLDLEPALLADLAAAEAKVAALEIPPELRELLEPGEEIRERWEDKEIEAQRKIALDLDLPAGLW